jgi:hypothetical protein
MSGHGLLDAVERVLSVLVLAHLVLAAARQGSFHQRVVVQLGTLGLLLLLLLLHLLGVVIEVARSFVNLWMTHTHTVTITPPSEIYIYIYIQM